MSDKDQGGIQKQKAWEPIWALVLTGILGIWVNFYGSTNTDFDLAFLLPYTFGQAVMVWALYHILLMAFTRGRIKFALVTFPVIYACLLAGSYLSRERVIEEDGTAAIALSEISKSYQSFIDQSTDEQGMPQQIDIPGVVEAKTGGSLGEIERFAKQYLAGLAEDRNNYLRELDAIQLQTALAPDYLAKTDGLSRARVIIEQARTIAQKYNVKSNVRMESARVDLLKLDLDEKTKASMLEGFEKGLLKGREKLNEVWAYELATVNEFDSIIRLMENNPKSWSIENGNIYFAETWMVNSYNGHLEEVNRLMKAQIDIQNESAKQFKESISNL